MPEAPPTAETLKRGSSCPYCEKGKLETSPSGVHLVCLKCARIVAPRRQRRASTE
jgi:hypothetical protein